MEIVIVVLIVIVASVMIGIATNDNLPKLNKRKQNKRKSYSTTQSKRSNSNEQKGPFKEIVQQTFPNYRVTEKNGQIIIYDINHRNEPDELVFIRLNQPEKKINLSGRMLIAHYKQQPTAAEMKRDFWNLD